MKKNFLTAATLAAAAAAQAPDKTMPSRLVAEPPTVDGVLDPLWQRAAVASDFTQVNPDEGAPPTQRTEVRVLHDHAAVYIAVYCHHDEPSRIVARTMKRDSELFTDDVVSVALDVDNDRRNGHLFQLSAGGGRRDALIENNDEEREEWDGLWSARATVHADGWLAEFRIPFQTVWAQPGRTTWGFNVERFLRLERESVRWASARRNIGIETLSRAGALTNLEGLRPGLGIDVKPVVTTRIDLRDGSAEPDPGLDAVFRLSPTMQLALTANTDFAETEVDDRRVNLTRFPLFFPEKRDFFLEDSQVFEFGGIGSSPRPFHSRRIGIVGGDPVDILAGAKLTGRVGRVQLGFLDVQTDSTAELRSENLAVGRVLVDVGRESGIGFIATHGDPTSEGDNAVVGADVNLRNSGLFGDRVIEANLWAQHSVLSRTEGSAFGASIAYPNDAWRWALSAQQIDEGFDPRLGFVSRRGIRDYGAFLRRRWRPNGWIRSIDWNVSLDLVTDLDDQLASLEANLPEFSIDNDAGDEIEFEHEYARERLTRSFEIQPGIVVPAGDYEWSNFRVAAGTSRGRALSAGAEFETGGFWTGTIRQYEANVSWRPSPHLAMQGEVEFNDARLPQGAFTTTVVRARAEVLLHPDLSWTTIAQFDTVSEELDLNSRIRWEFAPGSEMFLVFDQSFVDDSDGTLSTAGANLAVKVGALIRF